MGFRKSLLIIPIIAFVTYRYMQNGRPADLRGYLEGKNVVVTGASGGIGEQFALYYAKQGANVILIARRENLLKEVVKNCYKASPLPHGKALIKYIVADFNDASNSGKVVRNAIDLLGGSIDYLVLNHAYLLSKPEVVNRWEGTEFQHKTMNESLNINFLSFVRLAEVAMPYLKKSQGSICVISSFSTELAAYLLPYASSKGAVNAFFTGLRQELIHENINVAITLVHLGLIHVGHTQTSMDSFSAARGKNIRDITDTLPRTNADKAAADLVWATVSREADVYYPADRNLWLIRVARLFMAQADANMAAFEDFAIKLSNFKKSLGF